MAKASQTTQRIEPLADPSRRQDYYWKRYGVLKKDRASWDGEASELARFLAPRNGRFSTSETNQGGSKNTQIYDNTCLAAPDILAAGMMSGLTSPARPWMRLKHADTELMDYEPVKVWCADVTRKILDLFASTNTYRTLHQGYLEQGVFGTSAALVMPHPKKVLHTTALTWGEYVLATNADGEVDVIYREMKMNAGQMVREFGWDNVTVAVQNAYNRGDLDMGFDVVHAIEPNMDANPEKMDWRAMPFRSCYFQKDGPKDKYLREGGFRSFRGLCPRWMVTGSDTYGGSPGMRAIGDAKQLQHEQLRKSQGIDYMTRPPIGLPTSMKGALVDTMPGGVTFYDTATGAIGGQRQLFDVNLNLDYLLADIQDVRGRVNSAFFADLFLMIASMDSSGSKMTATEVAERHEEKLLMLGPVLERQQNENLDPLIDMAFDALNEAGMLPPPPPELDGQPLETELLGILAQAQRAVQTSAIDRFLIGVGQVGQFKPEVVDKIDGDMLVEIYGDSLGVDPRVLVDDREVKKIRAARAKQQADAAQAAQGAALAKGASELGSVPTQDGASNAGADVIGMFSGYQNPQAERIDL